MANKLVLQRLDKITMVRKGKATAKHPDLRTGVIEVVKSDEPDWYERFEAYIRDFDLETQEEPEDWVEAFALYEGLPEVVEKAKGKNYPDSEGPFAGPHNSFPINSQARVYSAAKLIGHAKNKAAVKAAIIRIARSKGYSLPKSWQTGSNVKKSELLAAVRSFFLGEDTGVTVEDDTEEVEKAANPMHTHDHAHLSSYGYSYTHNHAHAHRDGVTPNSDDHGSSETAHAHQHVSKAGEEMTQEQLDELQANIKGLHDDLEKLKADQAASVEKAKQLEAERDAAIAAKVEAAKQAEDAEKDKAEAVKKAEEAEAKLKDQSRQPLIAKPESVEKSEARKVTPDMKFDDAISIALHG